VPVTLASVMLLAEKISIMMSWTGNTDGGTKKWIPLFSVKDSIKPPEAVPKIKIDRTIFSQIFRLVFLSSK
jgi:hypothetical protein